jgi:hypothetical protein
MSVRSLTLTHDRLKWNLRNASVGDPIVWGNTANSVGCTISIGRFERYGDVSPIDLPLLADDSGGNAFCGLIAAAQGTKGRSYGRILAGIDTAAA